MVTLSDINITPLLDLAFVLLIIFVITTPLLEKGMELKLPNTNGTRVDNPPQKKDIRLVEISNVGTYALEKQRMPLQSLISQLASDYRNNPNLVVYIRADKDCRYDLVAQLLDGCQRYNISRYSLRTQVSTP